MKKLLILTAVGAILDAPAIAAQKCVVLDSNAEAISVDYKLRGTDWSVSFENVTVKGVGFCSLDAPTADEISQTLNFGYSGFSNRCNCWCRMTSPAVSQWVWSDEQCPASGVGGGKACMASCAAMCASSFRYPGDFRNKMLSTLFD